MTKDRNAVKAGVFMILSLVLIVAGVLAIAGSSRLTEKWQTRRVAFDLKDDLGGLRVGDDVRIGGFRVGNVKNIEVIGIEGATGQPRLVVTFAMPEKYTVREGSVIAVQTTVTGTSALNFENLGNGAELGEQASIKGTPSWISQLSLIAPEIRGLVADVRAVTVPKVNTAIDNANQTVLTFKDAGATAKEFVAHLRIKIDPIVDRYNIVTGRADEMMSNIRDVFGETKGDFKTTVANLRDATGTVKSRLPEVIDKVQAVLGKVEGGVDTAKSALTDVRDTADNAKAMTATARSILAGNRGKIDGMIASLKTTGDNLKNASAEIRRSPWRLLYKPGAGEVANLNLYDAARQFAEGANDMSDAATALRDALNDPQADETRVRKLVEKLDTSFQNFNQVESELWKKVRE